MEELQMRQRTTLAEVSVPSSSSVRREEELRQLGSDRGRSLSLGAVIAVEKLRSSSAGITRAASSSSNISSGGRTLLDIIRDEEQSTGRGSDHTTGGGSSSSANRINWRAFKNRLRIRRSSNGGDDRPENISPTDSPPEINELQTPPADNPPQQIRMSLMALLEQTDNQGARSGVPVSALLAEGEEEGAEDDDEDEDEDDDDGTGEDGGKMYVKCCVCMVRHKGAAFIPCGHTFCRLCSRELWISRGNCPLCNGFILEILDIF